MSAPTGTGQADPQDVLAGVGGSWLWGLTYAVLTLAAGVVMLVWPRETAHVVAVIFGLQLLVVGLYRFVAAFALPAGAGSRLLSVLMGAAAVLAGVLCLRNPLQTVAALSLIVGVFWLLTGLVSAYLALADRDRPHRALLCGAGLLGVVAGIVVLSSPVQSAVALARLLGLWLVLIGVMELVLALALKALGRRHPL